MIYSRTMEAGELRCTAMCGKDRADSLQHHIHKVHTEQILMHFEYRDHLDARIQVGQS